MVGHLPDNVDDRPVPPSPIDPGALIGLLVKIVDEACFRQRLNEGIAVARPNEKIEILGRTAPLGIGRKGESTAQSKPEAASLDLLHNRSNDIPFFGRYEMRQVLDFLWPCRFLTVWLFFGNS